VSDDDDEHERIRDARKREREAEKRSLEREKDALEREKERADRELERMKREIEREREREAREIERAHEREKQELERETEQMVRDAKRAGHDWKRWADPASGTDPQAEWERRHAEQLEMFERAWKRRLEQRERFEARRAEHHKRWRHHRKHWKHVHAEREMWMRMAREKGKRAWGPWWLQARMRRRIFIWLAMAFGCGATFMFFWPMLHWWHGLIALFSLSMMSGVIAFRLTQPLTMVIRVAQDIGDGKFETRLDVNRHGGETRVLAMAINDMAERIEQQLKDQRQLLAAVSHELRTPLGHMRVLIETSRNAIAGGTDCKALRELEREVLVLDDLVGRLLASSRLEFGNLDRRPIDLGELVSDVATSAGVAPEAIEAIGDVQAAVDPTLIRRAVANLLDNSRIHGNGAVAVRIERRARQIAIEVDDAGPGVPADRRADAFRAFVPSHAGGLGLGLALVSRIAVAHGGGAWITDRPGGGARVGFTVEIEPVVRDEAP
jgi:signal transduction histidine kinase